MFERKRCPNCGERVKGQWEYCPRCGEELVEKEKEEVEFRPFGMFEEIDREFERIDKTFGSEFFRMPRLKPIRGGGISITIHSATGREPRVEIKTSGDYKKVEPEIKRKLGVKPAVEEIEEEGVERKKPVRVPKITEEPETRIETVGNRQKIQVKLPDVKDEKNIEIKKLEQSIEIKALAGDKAYFKLIPIASNASISGKEFKNGVLRIEVER